MLYSELWIVAVWEEGEVRVGVARGWRRVAVEGEGGCRKGRGRGGGEGKRVKVRVGAPRGREGGVKGRESIVK